MEAQSTRANLLTLQPLMRLELLIASLFPVTCVFLIAAFSTRLIMSNLIWEFIAFSLSCAVIIFFAEFALISMMQRATRRHLSGLIAVCQAYLAGNKEQRAVVQGDTELTTVLAKTLNSLLDFTAAQEKNYISQKAASEINEESLKKRLKQFILEVAPVITGTITRGSSKCFAGTRDCCGVYYRGVLQLCAGNASFQHRCFEYG